MAALGHHWGAEDSKTMRMNHGMGEEDNGREEEPDWLEQGDD